MLVPVGESSTQIDIKKSRFLSFAQRIDSIEEVKTHISAMRNLHPQANHVVHAAIVGKDASQFSFSDDREPKNTAGRPMLEVLKGSGISNILVMVVRYFGGTKLGTGGLVRAYSDATKAVLEEVKTEELVEKVDLTIIVDYDIYEQIKNLIDQYNCESSENFDTSVTIKASVAVNLLDQLTTDITNLSASRATIII
jgi:uncharacterized YigZ family protein